MCVDGVIGSREGAIWLWCSSAGAAGRKGGRGARPASGQVTTALEEDRDACWRGLSHCHVLGASLALDALDAHCRARPVLASSAHTLPAVEASCCPPPPVVIMYCSVTF